MPPSQIIHEGPPAAVVKTDRIVPSKGLSAMAGAVRRSNEQNLLALRIVHVMGGGMAEIRNGTGRTRREKTRTSVAGGY